MLDFNPGTASGLLADGFGFVAVGGDATTLVRGMKQLLGSFAR